MNNKINTLSKILAGLAVVGLAILAINISAATNVDISDYNALTTELSTNNEVELTLTDDIEIPDDTSINIAKDKEFTLNLNGHTISGSSVLAQSSVLIQNNGKLTIKDSTDTEQNGTGDGKIIFTATQPDTKASPTYASNLLNNNGTLIIEGGYLGNETSTTTAAAANTIDNYSNNSQDAEIIINGGKVFSKVSRGVRLFTTQNTYDNKITVNGGIIEGAFGIQLQVANAKPKATITINSGDIIGKNIGLYIYDESQQQNDVNLQINGGNFISNKYALYIFSAFAKSIINGGNFESTSSAFYYYDGLTAPRNHDSSSIIINGGNFSTTDGSQSTLYIYNPYSLVEINDGNFTGNGTILYYYGSFSDKGSTKTNLQVNGGNFESTNGEALYVYNDYSNVEINDGIFSASYPIYYYGYYNANSAHNIVNGGTFNGGNNLLYLAYAADSTTDYPSNLAINGGKFTGDFHAYGYNGSWYFTDNIHFINNGFFKEKTDYYWPYYVKEGFWATDSMKSAPEGFPYTIGHKINLLANYPDGTDSIIYTLSDGKMTELQDAERPRYKFESWNTKSDGSGETISQDSIINEDTDLYAQWSRLPGDTDTEIITDGQFRAFVDQNNLLNAALEQEDYDLLTQGRDITIQVSVDNVTVPEITKEQLEQTAKDSGFQIGSYFDVNLRKIIKYNDTIESEEDLYSLNTPIQLFISVPNQLLSHAENIFREFKVMREHNGIVDILDSEYNADRNILSFYTDKFSTYSIIYKDTEQPTNAPNTGKNFIKDAGALLLTDSIIISVYALVLLGRLIFNHRKKIFFK